MRGGLKPLISRLGTNRQQLFCSLEIPLEFIQKTVVFRQSGCHILGSIAERFQCAVQGPGE